ncbi:MAG TPA: DUF1080 domain-containing protein [Bryobacteraceae bacterium]|nr:DUF1080 domain-containing protein [Bryobacteraceae bacterium]
MKIALLAVFLMFADDKDFKPLFNGKDLTGWTLVKKSGSGYRVENGVLICPEDGGGNLLTEEEFDNFVLRFDFKLTPGGNNGVGIRAPLAGDIAYSGMEIQILDHDHEKYKGWLKPFQRHGSVYDMIPAKADALKPVGEWNTEEISADGSRIRVTLNGKLITDADLSTITDPEVLKKHPGVLRKVGRIGFLGHGSHVEFRNIRIKRL